jgi:predicted MFS family arabinose efflux permease
LSSVSTRRVTQLCVSFSTQPQAELNVGYSLGSAIGGLILAAGTGPGHLFPDDSAYTTAALVGIGAMAITTLTSLALARRRSSDTNP